MYGKEGSSPVIFFSTLPALEDLCVIDVSIINKTDRSAPGAQSILHPQVIRCRELIFTEPEIIASPSFGDDCTFHVILKQSLYRTGRLQSRFQKIGLKASSLNCVTPTVFQSCLNYTIQARIAPRWNRAGQWLIQGRDFLTHKGYANAVKMDLTVTTGELFFTLEASTVRFPSLQLMDLDVLGAKYDQFVQDPTASIESHSIMQTWCHVLPSMKKGQIVSVYHNLPRNGRFKSYQDMKRHWKNSYGYRLPENDTEIIYYQIYFRPLGDRLFTYPDICLRAREIQKLPRVDPRPILSTFLQDLQAKMTNVCGTRLILQSKAKYPVVGLYESNQEKDPGMTPNLSNKNPTPGRIIYRNSSDLQQRTSRTPISTNHSSSSAGNRINQNSNSLSSTSREVQSSVPHSETIPLPHTVNAPMAQTVNVSRPHTVTVPEGMQQNSYLMQSYVSSSANSQSEDILNHRRHSYINPLSSCQNSNVAKPQNDIVSTVPGSKTPSLFGETSKIIPKFQVKKPACTVKVQNLNNTTVKRMPKLIPSFKKKASSMSSSKDHTITNSSCPTESSKVTEKTTSVLSHSKVQTPSFSSVKPQTLSSKLSMKKSASDSTKVQGKVTTNILNNVQKVQSTTPQSTCRSVSMSSVTPGTVGYDTSERGDFILSSVCLNSEQHIKVTSSSSVTSTSSAHGVKRFAQQVDVDEGTPKPKKPKSRPQVQENIDVEQLARAGQLNKVNGVTLMAWLKTRGVPYKSKDKKKDIEDKVRFSLNLHVAES